jgi:hypothetical protein
MVAIALLLIARAHGSQATSVFPPRSEAGQGILRQKENRLLPRPIQLRSSRMKNWTHRFLFLSILFFSSNAWAIGRMDEEVRAMTEPPQTNAVSRHLFDFESNYVFGSDLHRNGSFGDQDAFQNWFSYAQRIRLSGPLYLHLGIAYDRIDFGGTSAPVPSHLQGVAAVIGIDYMHGDDVGAFLELRPGFFTEDDFNSSSFDVPITLGRIWVLQPDKLYLFTGINAAFLRGWLPVLPIGGLIWMPNDQWKVMAILPEPRVIYSPSDKLSFWLGGEFVGGSYRTDEDSTIVPTALNNAQVDYSDYRVGGGFIFSPSDSVSLDLGAGYSIERSFDFHRADIKYKTDPAPYLRLQVKAKF